MQKTKSFLQYSDSNFSIIVKISINGNIRNKNGLRLYGECTREYSKKYYQENKERKNEIRKIYRKNNPEKDTMYRANRREFGFNPVNNYFDGAHFHHTHEDDNHDIGIFIPIDLHRSIWHSYKDKESMNRINTIAYKWLKEQ